MSVAGDAHLSLAYDGLWLRASTSHVAYALFVGSGCTRALDGSQIHTVRYAK